MNRQPIAMLALVLVLIGALNWGLVGLFNFDLVAAVLGTASLFSRVVYTLVGISAVITAAYTFSSKTV